MICNGGSQWDKLVNAYGVKLEISERNIIFKLRIYSGMVFEHHTGFKSFFGWYESFTHNTMSF